MNKAIWMKWHFKIIAFVGFQIFLTANSDVATNTIRRKLEQFNIKNTQDPYRMVEALKKEVLAIEKELKQAEEVNKNVERIIPLVSTLGLVDSFLIDRTKTMIKKIAMLADADDGRYEKEFDKKYFEKCNKDRN